MVDVFAGRFLDAFWVALVFREGLWSAVGVFSILFVSVGVSRENSSRWFRSFRGGVFFVEGVGVGVVGTVSADALVGFRVFASLPTLVGGHPGDVFVSDLGRVEGLV